MKPIKASPELPVHLESEALPLDRDLAHAVVGPVMRLHQQYDPGQHWLGFVAALIRQTRPQVASAHTPQARQALHRLAKRNFVTPARCDPDSMAYLHQGGVAQYELPFIECRLVSDNEWEALSTAKFPAWDMLDGHPPVLNVAGHDRRDVSEWLNDNCRGRYRYSHGLWRNVTFARLSDYAMGKLRFN